MYGAWARFMFGSQATDFKSNLDAAANMIRFMMYDYDLYISEQAEFLLRSIGRKKRIPSSPLYPPAYPPP
jgi:hypothetical protein